MVIGAAMEVTVLFQPGQWNKSLTKRLSLLFVNKKKQKNFIKVHFWLGPVPRCVARAIQ